MIQRILFLTVVLFLMQNHCLAEVPTDSQNESQSPVAATAEGISSKKNQSTVSNMSPPAKAEICTACHGSDGNSLAPTWPKIANQPIKYLMQQLKDYRKGQSGNRFDPNMYPMTAGLTDQDIAELAAFYAEQKVTPGTATPENLALGEKLFRGGNPATGVPACGACHSVRGEGNNPAGFPRLSGQYAAYTIDQLKKFKSGARKNDTNGIMRDIAKKMSDQEMEAVSNYVSGLH